MMSRSPAALPTLIVILTGTAWGIYWIPVRAMEQAGLAGAWGSFSIVLAAACLLAPIGLRALLREKSPALTLFAIFIGGAGFMLYSVGFIYGRVAIIAVLFFLTPVWSTLIARFIMGWDTPRLRIYAIGVGLTGLMAMLSADGSAPIPRSPGEWMALASGIIWSISTTIMRATPPVAPKAAAFVFALGALSCAALLAPVLAPFPSAVLQQNTAQIAVLALGTGGVFWALTMIGLLWAAPQLDPARVGILLMAEVLIGSVTAAVLADEAVTPLEILGGVLVLVAGVLEVWPVKTPPPQTDA